MFFSSLHLEPPSMSRSGGRGGGKGASGQSPTIRLSPPLADSSERGWGQGGGLQVVGWAGHELVVTWQLWFAGADGGGRSSPSLPTTQCICCFPCTASPPPPPPFCHITVSPQGLQQLLGSCPSLAPCSLPPCDSCPPSTGPPAPQGQGGGARLPPRPVSLVGKLGLTPDSPP